MRRSKRTKQNNETSIDFRAKTTTKAKGNRSIMPYPINNPSKDNDYSIVPSLQHHMDGIQTDEITNVYESSKPKVVVEKATLESCECDKRELDEEIIESECRSMLLRLATRGDDLKCVDKQGERKGNDCRLNGEGREKETDNDGDDSNNSYSEDTMSSNKRKGPQYISKQETSSKYIGVCWVAKRNKWRTRIRLPNHKRKHLGYFDLEEEAARAYDKKYYQIYRKVDGLNLPKEFYEQLKDKGQTTTINTNNNKMKEMESLDEIANSSTESHSDDEIYSPSIVSPVSSDSQYSQSPGPQNRDVELPIVEQSDPDHRGIDSYCSTSSYPLHSLVRPTPLPLVTSIHISLQFSQTPTSADAYHTISSDFIQMGGGNTIPVHSFHPYPVSLIQRPIQFSVSHQTPLAHPVATFGPQLFQVQASKYPNSISAMPSSNCDMLFHPLNSDTSHSGCIRKQATKYQNPYPPKKMSKR